ncbi:MAG TPA: alpha/beta hydrolase, partial [Synergistales bacterium]|nr:alpha/beta hydrolase [Synergistales bacterium]
PVTLAGFSWGAWLGTIFSAMYPELVRKLVLISSGAFLPKYSRTLLENRLNRLNWEEQEEVLDIMDLLDTPDFPDKDALFCRFGHLMKKADSWNLIPHEGTSVKCSFEIFRKIWCEASELRSNGKLLQMAEKINCPVVAIHGDHDPTPIEGIKEALSPLIMDFQFYLLEKCGHYPWYESYARDSFFALLEKILGE